MQKKKVTERNIAGNKKKFRKRTGILLLMMLLLLNATVPVSAKSKARFTTATRITAKVLDGLDLQKVDKVMIVAHPDDEMLWGGMHLIQDDYLVVCLTNANTRTYGRTRMREFKKVMEKTGDIGLMLNYPDYSNQGGIADWTSCSDQIRKDIDTLLAYKNWKEVVYITPTLKDVVDLINQACEIVSNADILTKDLHGYNNSNIKEIKIEYHMEIHA